MAILGINVRVTGETKMKILDHVKQSYNVKYERKILSHKLKGISPVNARDFYNFLRVDLLKIPKMAFSEN